MSKTGSKSKRERNNFRKRRAKENAKQRQTNMESKGGTMAGLAGFASQYFRQAGPRK